MSSETRRASLGWERIRACVPQVHGTEGSRRSTQEWTEINDSRRRQKSMGRGGWDGGGGNHSLSVDYLYNGQLPHRSQDDLGVQDSGSSDPQDEKEVSSCRYELPMSRASRAEALQNAAHCQTRSPDTWSRPISRRQKRQHRAVTLGSHFVAFLFPVPGSSPGPSSLPLYSFLLRASCL